MTRSTSRKAVRFALGSPEKPFTGVWRFWSQGDEVYIAERSGLRHFKVSLHSSGKFRAKVGNYVHHLLPPRPLQDGTKHGPILIFPGYRSENELEKPEELFDTDIKWMPAPGPDFMLKVAPIFGASIPSSPINNWTKAIGAQSLRNGSYCWLEARMELITEPVKIKSQELREQLKINYTGDELEAGQASFVYMEQDKKTGISSILVVPTDADNWARSDS